MTITIKQNDYREVTECRENIVQHICDAFLHPCCWSVFHPCSNGMYRNLTNYVCTRRGEAYGFSDKADSLSSEKNERIYKCEVELAIKLLLQSGYYLYRIHEYGSWVGYKISGNPRLTDGTKVDKIYESDWDGYFK